MGHGRQRTSTSTLHPKCVRDASTRTRCKMLVPFLRPRQEEEEMANIDDIHKECLFCKQKEGRPAVKALKEPHQEAFSKELAVVKAARQAYYRAHWPNFKQEWLYDLSFTFWQMATSTTLLGIKIHEVQES